MLDKFASMIKTKAVLLYNLYPLWNWKSISDHLLSNVPHDDIMVHINIPKRNPVKALIAYLHLKKNKKVKRIFFSLNFKAKGESVGFEVFREKINFNKYDIASYIHSKGSSRKRKNTEPIKDWVRLLRYFTVEKLDEAQLAFENGYYLYGVNLLKGHKQNDNNEALFPQCKFHYSGNFVTINLRELRREFLNTKCLANYYGVEIFWGTLCDIDKAFCVHQSNINHYTDVYPKNNYQ